MTPCCQTLPSTIPAALAQWRGIAKKSFSSEGREPEETEALNNGLVSHWPLAIPDQVTRLDFGPGAHDFANGTNPTLSATALPGESYSANFSPAQFFNRSLTSVALNPANQSSFTYSGWIRLTSKSTTQSILRAVGTASASDYMHALTYDHLLDRFVWNCLGETGGEVILVAPMGSPSTGVWYFFECGYDFANRNAIFRVLPYGGTTGTYAEAPLSGGMKQGAIRLRLGQAYSGSLQQFTGLACRLNFHNRLLTTPERNRLLAGDVWPWAGFSPAAERFPDPEPTPAAPENFAVATNVATFDDETEGEWAHELWHAADSGSPFELLTILPPRTVEYDDAAGDVSTRYKLRAVSGGNPSEWRHSHVPAAPTGLTITEGPPGEWTLAWTNAASNATQIEVWRESDIDPYALAFTLDIDDAGESLAVGAVFDASWWKFKLRAKNDKGVSSFSNEVQTLAPPATPVSLIIANVGSGPEYELQWADGGGAAPTGYKVWSADDGGAVFTELEDLPGNLYIDTTTFGVPASGQRAYYVTAYNAAGSSSGSGIVYTAPRDVTSLAADGGSVDNHIGATWVHVAEDDPTGGWVDEYEVRWRNVTTSGAWHNEAASPFGSPSASHYVAGDASNGDTIEIAVRAKKGAFTSEWQTAQDTVTIDP